MSEEVAVYDAAEYLKSEEDIALFLDAVMDESGDDPAAVARALGAVARARNISELSRQTGISREGIYKALSGQGNPSFDTIMRIVASLGLRLTFQHGRGAASA